MLIPVLIRVNRNHVIRKKYLPRAASYFLHVIDHIHLIDGFLSFSRQLHHQNHHHTSVTVMRVEGCFFCQKPRYPGHGTRYVDDALLDEIQG